MRITLLGLVLLVALLFGYLHLVGLPEFLKVRVRAELLSKGVKVDFKRLHLRAFRHVLLEGATLQLPDGEAGRGTELAIPQAELVFDKRALSAFSIKIKGLAVSKASLRLSLGPGATDDELAVDDISGELALPGPDEWHLERLKANLLGLRVVVSARLIQPDLLFAARGPATTNEAGTADWRATITAIQRRLEAVKVTGEPVVMLSATVDGRRREVTSFSAKTRVDGLEDGRWYVQDAYLDARGRIGLASNDVTSVSLNVRAGRLREGTNQISQPAFDLKASGLVAERLLLEADGALKFRALNGWRLAADESASEFHFQTSTNGVGTLRVIAKVSGLAREQGSLKRASADWSLSANDGFEGLVRLAGEFSKGGLPTNGWSASALVTGEALRKGAVTATGFSTRLNLEPSSLAVPSSEDAGFWKLLNLSAAVKVDGFAWEAASLPKVGFDLDWRGGLLALTNIDLRLPHGTMNGHFEFSPNDGATAFRLRGNPRPADWLPLLRLSPEEMEWVRKFDLQGDPAVSSEGSFRLGSPTNVWAIAAPRIRVDLSLPKAKVFGVEVDGALLRGDWLDGKVVVNRFAVNRPEGGLEVSGGIDVAERELNLKVESRIDPTCLTPLLKGDGLKNMLWLRFPTPPHLAGVLSGPWDKPELIRFEGAFDLTNTYYRQRVLESVHANLLLTNREIVLTDAFLSRAGQTVQAPWLKVAPSELALYVTNGLSRIDPYFFTGLIGEHVLRAISPYRFNKVPEVVVDGRIPLADPDGADIRFQVKGEEFSWWRFRIPKVEAEVLWKGDSLVVTNVSAEFYGGHLDWNGAFKFRPGQGEADYQFSAVATNVNLAAALADVAPMTNRLTGDVHGRLVIDKADTTSILSWNGHGDAVLHDGFLWSIPVFGIASPMLNSVSPGLGESKVSEGTTTFTVSDGKFHTRDMQLRSPAVRLRYEGSVDFDANLDARVEALFFRDANLLAKVFGVALTPLSKVTESRVTGTLSAPKSSLMHIPKFLLIPFHPLQSLKDALGQEKPVPPRRPPSE